MKHSCTLMEKYINLIKSGKKTVEARVAVNMFLRWREGDVIDFFSRRDSSVRVVVQITGVRRYSSFREMLVMESPEKLIPGVKDINLAEQEYLKIPNYAEREGLGVLAFHLRVMS